jgi:hypothetical protein
MSLYIWVMFNIHEGIFYCLGRALLAQKCHQNDAFPHNVKNPPKSIGCTI